MLQALQIPVFSNNSLSSPAAEQLLSLLKVLHKGLSIPECCDIFRLGPHRISKTLVQTILPKRTKRDHIPPLLIKQVYHHPKSPLGILLIRFFSPIVKAQKKLQDNPLSTVLKILFTEMKLLHDPEDITEPSVLSKMAGEILSISKRFDTSLIPLPSLISEVETRKKGYVGRQNSVHVLTIHRAKGLEFDYVFVPSIQPGIFPTKNALYENRLLEEERRLLYVALTRAKKKLYLSRHRSEEDFPWKGFLAECLGEDVFCERDKPIAFQQ
jgi:hypothetical protein